jgi:predicted permease
MTATGLVLAVACANIAGVLLARAVTRQQELGVRLSLGATRRRLVRQLLTESLLLSGLGGAGGLVIASWIAPIVFRLAVPSGNQDAVPDLRPDAAVLVVLLALSAIAGLLFGLLPAWHATRVDLTSTLKGGLTLFGQSIRRTRLLNGLVALQMALALVLLVSASLLVRSMLRVYAIDPGFETARLLSMELEIALDGPARATAPTLIRQAAEDVRRLPGVRAVTIARFEPLAASNATYRWRDDQGRSLFHIAMNDVSADFFDVLRIPLVRGRTFSRDEIESGAPVVIITDALARRLFPDRDPIGQVIERLARATVIGVTRDAHTANLTSPAPMIVYRPLHLAAFGAGNSPDGHTFVALVATTHGSPRMSLAAAERAIRRLDPRIAVDLQTGEQGLERWTRPARLASILSASLGTLALLLTLVGIYGVVAFAVGQRTREIAMRMALGAARRDIVRLVLRQALTPITIGVAAGWLGLLVVTPLLRAQLHDLSPFDPTTFASVSLAVIAATTCAISLPARRAARLDPMMNLRRE